MIWLINFGYILQSNNAKSIELSFHSNYPLVLIFNPNFNFYIKVIKIKIF
jgi:hypothetical protein